MIMGDVGRQEVMNPLWKVGLKLFALHNLLILIPETSLPRKLQIAADSMGGFYKQYG